MPRLSLQQYTILQHIADGRVRRRTSQEWTTPDRPPNENRTVGNLMRDGYATTERRGVFIEAVITDAGRAELAAMNAAYARHCPTCRCQKEDAHA